MTTPKIGRCRGLTHRSREAVYGYAFVLVWIVGFALFTAVPLLQTLYYSLNQVTVTATGISLEHIQWQNYTRALFTDPTFVQLLIEYAIETLVAVPIILIFSLIIALFLNLKFRFKGIFRTIFFLPVVITSGPVIQELVAQGATSVPGLAISATATEYIAQLPDYFRNPIEYLLTSFILILWFSGVQILIYLSSLQKIDQSIYQAAAIDGASAWESFWKITLPALSTTTLIVAVYTIITLSHFSENKVIKYIYSQTYAVGGGIGYASAMSFLYFFVLFLLLTVIYLLLNYRAKRQFG
ncbi:MAG: sugar ABC transporter permease [Chloroflexi bacterium]|nr:sugar ABC transporter permease [Ardenticatenaceae bacterium]MBL1129769.1 sugar ABC transporter permease [Chloroflexota bacterium]NOG35853.1 sugar ABC transporter permease [Chloroflexota bacterium]GIK55473.1 MAG: ABC transporter permease [Chloroflexota bacterium]